MPALPTGALLPHPPPRPRESALDQAVRIGFRFLAGVVAMLALAWLASGVRQIQPGERGIVRSLGNIAREAGPGLVFAWPRPIEEVVIVPGPERPQTRSLNVLDLRDPERPRAGDGLDLRRDGGYALCGDAGIVHLSLTLTYRIADARAFVAAGGDAAIGPLLDRAAAATALHACAGRPLDALIALSGSSTGASNAEQRDRLRADLASSLDARLAALRLGVQIARVDLTTRLPPRAQRAVDGVLAASQSAAKRQSEARAQAERTVQSAHRDAADIAARSDASARESLGRARATTAAIAGLHAERSPAARALLLIRLYRERLDAILRRTGAVIAVDGRTPIQIALPGERGGAP